MCPGSVSPDPIPVCWILMWVGCENPPQAGSWSRNFPIWNIIPTFLLSSFHSKRVFCTSGHNNSIFKCRIHKHPVHWCLVTPLPKTPPKIIQNKRDTSKRDLGKISPKINLQTKPWMGCWNSEYFYSFLAKRSVEFKVCYLFIKYFLSGFSAVDFNLIYQLWLR